jgi:hypothetical protein
LSGCVVVGDPARVGRSRARVFGLFDGRTEQRRHTAGLRVGGGLRQLGATRREPHAFFEIKRAGRDQGAEVRALLDEADDELNNTAEISND